MYNVTPHAVGVIVYKVVGNRYIEKRVSLRVEHVRHSACRQEFLDRVQTNHAKHVEAKEKGGEPDLLCLFILERTLILSIRTLSIVETRPRLASGGAHRVGREKCSADYCTCSLRDNDLNHPRCHPRLFFSS